MLHEQGAPWSYLALRSSSCTCWFFPEQKQCYFQSSPDKLSTSVSEFYCSISHSFLFLTISVTMNSRHGVQIRQILCQKCNAQRKANGNSLHPAWLVDHLVYLAIAWEQLNAFTRTIRLTRQPYWTICIPGSDCLSVHECALMVFLLEYL